MSRVSTRSKRSRTDSDDDSEKKSPLSSSRDKSPSRSPKKARADEDADATTISYWEYKTKTGWTPFAKEDNDVLNKAYEKSPKGSPIVRDLSFNRKAKIDYIFDFKKMIQTNSDTKNTRQIRRITATAPADDSDTMKDDDEAGYAKLVRRHSIEWATDGDGDGEDAEKKEGSSSPSTKRGSSKGKRAKKDGEEEEKHAPKLAPLPPALTVDEIKAQARLGAQSCRSRVTYDKIDYGHAVKGDKHATHCFDIMIENEKRLCGEYAVFYHSYSYAALLYEVQASVAAVLFRFKSKFATLPRLLVAPYHDIPDADALMKLFPTLSGQDHNPTYRAVAICGTTSLLAPDSEAPPSSVFLSGYSCTDLSFMGVLEQLLQSCYVPKKEVKALAKKIVSLSEKHGLDVSQFGGRGCASGRAGHMLQIFVKRHLVDRYLYAAHPYGVIDHKRMPLGKFMDSKGPMQGQVRILCHPTIFMRANCVRMFVLSADPTFHQKREKFQDELTALLNVVVGADESRTAAARGIHGGYLPNWYDSADQSQLAAVDNKYK